MLFRSFVERWLRLARIQIQTASASASAEMTLEGLHEFEEVRDYLYSKMRGVRGASPAAPRPMHLPTSNAQPDLAAALHEVAVELRAVAAELQRRRSS